ncbi:MAG: 4-hydroxy-3-methylbut-2-enyl diphosphate reductase [Treponema sp.]|nr:4-hydroxy-3-methylbut-2-enyl diphosphate reductase [Treponema sp.]
MEVIRAKVLGYCMGVRRAVETAGDALLQNTDKKKVYTLGPLIHNQTALDALKRRGLEILPEGDVDKADKDSVVIIRAHGVPPEVIERLEDRGCSIINATCTRVTASQKIAAQYAVKGAVVILAGDRNHGEVTGIAGYAGSHFALVQNRADAKALDLKNTDTAVLLSQTTFSPVEFEAIAGILKKKCHLIDVMNTICPATKERQKALRKLCPQVNGVLVIGGRNSANTSRLLLAAKKLCAHADLIETAGEIPAEYFAMQKVGITAGASTPDEVINEVEQKLLEKNL